MSRRDARHTVDRVAARNRVIAVRAAVLRLAGVLRSARVYSADNRALQDGIESAVSRIAPLVENLGELLIKIEGVLVRVNGTMIAQLGKSSVAELSGFADDLAARGLGGLHFQGAPSPEEVRALVDLWGRHDDLPPEVGARILNDELHDRGVDSILVLPPQVVDEEELAEMGPDVLTPEDGLRAYCALLVVSELLMDPQTVALQSTAERAQAALQVAADVVAAAPEALMCAATHRDSDNYEVVHAANTAVLSMVLARAIGLGLAGILDCGRGALFCDIGMASTAADARRLGELDDDHVSGVLAHPLVSFAAGMADTPLKAGDRARLAVAFEHHCGVDGEGYPAPAPGGRPHLYSRIVSIADGYDALVHDRGDRPGLPRPVALEVLYQEAGKRFDRMLLHEFAGMMGRFPPGSVVRLQEGHIAMTAAPSWDARMFDRPSVLIVRDREGRPITPPQALDLSLQRGEKSTRIAGVLDDRLFPETLIGLVLGEDVTR